MALVIAFFILTIPSTWLFLFFVGWGGNDPLEYKFRILAALGIITLIFCIGYFISRINYLFWLIIILFIPFIIFVFKIFVIN